MNPFRRTLNQALLIALTGALAGLAINHRLLADVFAGRLVPPSPAAAVSAGRLPQPVLLAAVRDLAAAGALLVDARDSALYGEGHLPGAISLPLATAPDALRSFCRSAAMKRTLIVYCNGYGCPDSFDLGLNLLSAGCEDVRVFEGGYPEWRDAGLPVTRSGQ